MLKKNRIIIISIFIIFIFSIVSQVFAETKIGLIDLTQKANLTIHFSTKESPANNIKFKLYKVANINKECEFKLTNKFKKYPISLENINIDNWKKLATTVETYIVADNIVADKVESTDIYGNASFNDLELGLYLVIGNQYVTEKNIYTPTPVFICLPTQNKQNIWEYNISIKIKYETEKIEEKEDTISKKVMLIWDDNNDKTSRPQSVKVYLLKDGKIYDTIELSKVNNWKHIWEGLSNKHKWRIVEAGIEDKYTTTFEEQGPTFVITKKYRENKPDEDKPNEKPEDNMAVDRLPATGVLWWPVPVLITIGVILFAIGWIKRKGEEYEK